jgi:hypothetical protein
MKKVNPGDLRLIHSALTHFVGGMISSIDENFRFETIDGGLGRVAANRSGDYDVYIGDELVYTIEGEFFDIINYDEKKDQLIELYERMCALKPETLKYMTRVFYYKVRTSMEDIILNMNLPLEGQAVIGNYQVFYSPDHKLKVNLN